MSERVGMLRLIALAIIFVLSCSQQIGATESVITTKNFVVSYEKIDRTDAEEFATTAERYLAAMTSYLGRKYPRKIQVSIKSRYVFPQYSQKDGEIFIPANRIHGDGEKKPGRWSRGTGLLLVLTPIVAPSKNAKWGEFLETGLRVFVQEKLGEGGVSQFPTMGRDLHKATSQLALEYGKFIPLADVEEFRTWRTRMTRTRSLAYLEAGSFVRYLIEQYGLEKFMDWYDGQPFENLYSRNMFVVEQEWKRHLLTGNR